MRNGFTLAEVIIVMAVTSIVTGLLLLILVNTSGLFYKQSPRVTQGVGLNDALSNIRSKIKETKNVAPSYPEDSSPTFTSGVSTLILKLSSISSSGDLISGNFDYVVFTTEDSKLKYKLFPGAGSTRVSENQILTDNVETLFFEYFDSSGAASSPSLAVKVKVSLRLKQKAGAGYEVNIATSEANLRND